jgi:hypothetical protein
VSVQLPVILAILVLIPHLQVMAVALLALPMEVEHLIAFLAILILVFILLQDQIVLVPLLAQEAHALEVVPYAVIRQACQLALVLHLIREEDARIMDSLKILG